MRLVVEQGELAWEKYRTVDRIYIKQRSLPVKRMGLQLAHPSGGDLGSAFVSCAKFLLISAPETLQVGLVSWLHPEPSLMASSGWLYP